jgi:hypothetical protein
MVRGVPTRGLALLDLALVLAVLALLVYVVRLDWPRRPARTPPAASSTTAAR